MGSTTSSVTCRSYLVNFRIRKITCAWKNTLLCCSKTSLACSRKQQHALPRSEFEFCRARCRKARFSKASAANRNLEKAVSRWVSRHTGARRETQDEVNRNYTKRLGKMIKNSVLWQGNSSSSFARDSSRRWAVNSLSFTRMFCRTMFLNSSETAEGLIYGVDIYQKRLTRYDSCELI